MSKKGPFFRRLIDFCYRYKSAYRRRGMPTPILDFLIFNKMSAIVGGKIRLLLSGGAPLSPDTHDFVRCALDLPLVQVILKVTNIQSMYILKRSVNLESKIPSSTKAELLQEGIFFLIHLFARDVLVMKKLEIEKTKPTFIISVLKVEY